MKICTKCKQELTLDHFYRKFDNRDSYYSICKKCKNQYGKEWRRNNPDYMQKYDKRRNKTVHRKLMNLKKSRDFRKRYPEKYSAWNKTKGALDGGRLIKLPCVVCGEHTVDAHHPDYTQPLYVVWLCRKHHKEAHAVKT